MDCYILKEVCIHFAVCSVVTALCLSDGYQHFDGGTCCLHVWGRNMYGNDNTGRIKTILEIHETRVLLCMDAHMCSYEDISHRFTY